MVITTIGSTLQPLLVVGGYTRTGCRVEPVPSYNPLWCAHTSNPMGNRFQCCSIDYQWNRFFILGAAASLVNGPVVVQ